MSVITSIVSDSRVLTAHTSSCCTGITGAVQFNGNTGQLEVSNGHNWMSIQGSTELKPSMQLLMVLEWATKKMEREAELAEERKHNPSIDSLCREIEQAEQNLEAVRALCGASK